MLPMAAVFADWLMLLIADNRLVELPDCLTMVIMISSELLMLMALLISKLML